MSASKAAARPERRKKKVLRGLGVRLPGLARDNKHNQPSGFRRFDHPVSGTEISERITLFHDASDGHFACVVAEDPWIRLTCYQFGGTYVSLAVGLRKSDLRQVGPGRQLAIDLDATTSRPLTAFARLNLRSPEQTETLYETLVLHEQPHDLRFNLDAIRLPFSDVAGGWLDLIFSQPTMCEVDIRSLAVSFPRPGGRHG